MSQIIINEENLGRFNKRLQKALNEEQSGNFEKIPLNQASKIFAKALGKDSEHELLTALRLGSKNSENKTSEMQVSPTVSNHFVTPNEHKNIYKLDVLCS